MKPLRLTEHDWLELEREASRRSLAEFAKLAWNVLEPSTPLKWGWVLDAICLHLEAITDGRITRLLINVPPGSMKSLLTAVIWPAWEWGPRGMPHMRYLGTSHSQTLAVRDNMKCRRLISSRWYQTRWPLVLVADQNAKTKFENAATGFREAMAFTSMTGSRGDRIILDDPISADGANSEVELATARITFTETLPTRVNNEHSCIVAIMQRLNEMDTSGVILEMGLPYEHLCIPMRFEEERAPTCIGWVDPRAKMGELMFPDRFPESHVSVLEHTLGAYGTAGQLQQRPAPRGGGMFKRADFEIVDAAPAIMTEIRAWDLAASDNKNADWTAGVKIGRAPDGFFYITDVRREQSTAAKIERLMVNTASQDGRSTRGSIPKEPGQAGKAQAQYLIRVLAGYTYTSSSETGSKITRADPFAAQVEAGNVRLVRGSWNEDYLKEAETFPMGKHDDQIDASSRAFNELTDGKQIYAPDISTMTTPPIAIPDYWEKTFAINVIGTTVAVLWGAKEPTTGAVHIYSEMVRSDEAIQMTVLAIKTRGEWIRGLIDLSSSGGTKGHGEQIQREYQAAGLPLVAVDRAVEVETSGVASMMAVDRVKIFTPLSNLIMQYQTYRQPENGQIPDDVPVMNAMRTLLTSFDKASRAKPPEREPYDNTSMVADTTAGY